MNINYKQSQFELFSRDPENAKKPSSKALALNIPLTLENLVIFVILSIIVLLFSFSIGVERGKRLVHNEIEKGLVQDVVPSSSQKVAETAEAPVLKSAKIDMSVMTSNEIIADEQVVEEQQVVEKEVVSGENYTVQVASFKLNKYALEEAETLRGKGYKAFVLKRGQYSIVCVGKFDQKSDAQRFAVPLKGRYGDYLIRRL